MKKTSKFSFAKRGVKNWIKLISVCSLLTAISCNKEETGNNNLYSDNVSDLSSKSVELPIIAENVMASTSHSNYPAKNAVDGNLSTRWTGNGIGTTLIIDLEREDLIDYVKIAHYAGNKRVYKFTIYTKSSTASDWTAVGSKTSSGDSYEMEIYDVTNSVGRYIMIESNGNTSNEWSDIKELEVYGTIGEVVSSVCEATVPNNRKAQVATGDIVILSWDAIPNIDHYNIRYKKIDETGWSYIYSVEENYISITGLTKREDYEWQIRSKCVDGTATAYTDAKSYFTTIADPNTIVEDDENENGYGPASVPVGTVEWQNWYLSVPIDRADGSGKATSIYYEDIESLNLTNEEKYYFDKNSDGSYAMTAKFTGYTTSGYYESFSSKYCRTELREYWQGNQTTTDNWYMGEGETHELETTLSVEKCEGEGKTYVAQIHGIKGTSLSGGELTASPATVKLFWEDNEIGLEYYTKDGIVNGEWTSSSGVEKPILGEVGNNKFTIRIKIEEGVLFVALYCSETGVNTGYVEYYNYLGNGYEYANYFKTGNYFRHDEDYTSVSEVTLYSAITNHSNAE